ncbi:MAG: hypothetical protein JW984_00490 [Deltaproteobacteria bacterium]|uniref:Uncharacterized protein n=1 Tax=Candidatus Zymogenus saltonus TaxID=2844893 RepID=A0A9D8PNB5_9DELT|nr:hypothetical protein [Candidatus Zymogenus saltonus]
MNKNIRILILVFVVLLLAGIFVLSNYFEINPYLNILSAVSSFILVVVIYLQLEIMSRQTEILNRQTEYIDKPLEIIITRHSSLSDFFNPTPDLEKIFVKYLDKDKLNIVKEEETKIMQEADYIYFLIRFRNPSINTNTIDIIEIRIDINSFDFDVKDDKNSDYSKFKSMIIPPGESKELFFRFKKDQGSVYFSRQKVKEDIFVDLFKNAYSMEILIVDVRRNTYLPIKIPPSSFSLEEL